MKGNEVWVLDLFDFLDEKLINEVFSFFGFKNIVFWEIIFLIFAVVSFCVFLIKNKKKNPTQILLDNVGLMIKNNENEMISKKEIYYYFVFSLKLYLKNQVQLDVDSKTDVEMIEELRLKLFDPNLLSELELILHRAYDSRFAGVNSENDVVKNDILWLLKLSEYINTSFFNKKMTKKSLRS